MPSGAKKRKAAKKKLEKASHDNGSHSLSHLVDDPKPHRDRESDSDEAKRRGKFNDVTVVSGDDFRESQKRNASEDRSSSSSSSSEDDEVKVEKENSGQSSYLEATQSDQTCEPSVGYTPDTRSSEIPMHTEVNEVASLAQELHSVTTDLVDSQMEQNMNEILPLSDEQTRRDTEGLLPKDSDVTTMDRDGIDGQCKEPEKYSSSEEQPLVYAQPLPVRRTSWMNCCGLLDVLSRGSRDKS